MSACVHVWIRVVRDLCGDMLQCKKCGALR